MTMRSEEEKTAANWLKETQKGYIRIVALILLSKKPHHGYEIMREIGERTMGFWRPTSGGIYPILQDLEKSGYVKGEWDSERKRKRKTYRINRTGKIVLKRALARESQIANNMGGLFKEFMKDVLEVELQPIAMPRRPPFFSVFLEERKEQPEDTIRIIENRRTQIENMVEELEKELGRINKRLIQLKQPRRKTMYSEVQP
jgi:DNA-binding PadR family transcriptional regulator